MKLKHLLTNLFFALIFIFNINAQSDQYLHFDGNNDYTFLPNASELLLNTEAISMTGWFYTDALNYGQGMMGLRNGNQGFYLIQLDNGILECRLESTTGLDEYKSPAYTALAEQWQHFAWIYDGSSVSLYVDGTLKGSSPASGTITDATVSFAVGRSILSNLNFYFGGRADEVTLWNKALSEEDLLDMMENELVGDEEGLLLYYKFNQGVPGDDNTSITHAISEVGDGEQDSELLGFALTGETSNFNGDLDESFQAISFPLVPNKLITDDPFELEAFSSSDLTVIYTIISGPATIDGNVVTLTGDPGEVVIEATQEGDGVFGPAVPVQVTFEVIDPALNIPNINVTNPLAGEVPVPELGPIHLATIVDIDFPELFSVSKVEFEVGGEIIEATAWKDGHYTAFWTPDTIGSHEVKVLAYNNYDAVATVGHQINIISDVQDVAANAIDGLIINSTISSKSVVANLPSYMGAYDSIVAKLEVKCPPGELCGEWDRVARVKVKTHEGEWIELLKYITPYGLACTHELEVTDFFSTLQGQVEFQVECVTFDTGYDYYLDIEYYAGDPEYNYATIGKLWHGEYPFGDLANLQPVEQIDYVFPKHTESAKIKLVASGHGWGPSNTNNAAEFSENIHQLKINDEDSYNYDNWFTCNPNPDECSPQNGYWYYDRAGFCPGAISPFTDFDLGNYIEDENVSLNFMFDEEYVDFCHSSNPDCVTGVTDNVECVCDDGFNPHLIMASTLISFSNTPALLDSLPGVVDTTDMPIDTTDMTMDTTDMPIDTTDMTGIEDFLDHSLKVYPNPAQEFLAVVKQSDFNAVKLEIFDVVGRQIKEINAPLFSRDVYYVRLEDLTNGTYHIILEDDERRRSMSTFVISK